MEKKIEVKNLRISFRTQGGKLQAVRDINFDLYKGETLAVVGESGSGKSVTARAIMGISALNAVIENGEILFDGEDLVKYTEEDFQEIRGNKVAMIFQDPMSSLNPIVKVGKQLTEAMLLKNRSDRKNAKKDFYATMRQIEKAVGLSGKEPNFKELAKKFTQVEKEATRQEAAYLQALKNAEEAKCRIDDLLVAFDKKDEKTVSSKCDGIYKYASKCENRFLKTFSEEEYVKATQSLKEKGDKKEILCFLNGKIEEGLSLKKPEFFTIAYCESLQNEKSSSVASDVSEVNESSHQCSQAFQNDFLSAVEKGAEYSVKTAYEAKCAAVGELRNALTVLQGEWNKKEVTDIAKSLFEKVKAAANPLVKTTNVAERTFVSGLSSLIRSYFAAQKKNAAEQKRFDAQSAKKEEMLKKGKRIDWEVVPPAITDLSLIKQKALSIISDVLELYENLQQPTTEAVHATAVELVEYLKRKASTQAAKMTKTAAKRRAIRLLIEVGIPEPEKRYDQYPFQMSGGQRQRVVIAIALSADPEVLICDEPTTALDVTIQSQILELIGKVKKERELSVIFITHDLGVVANIADRIAVMYAGKIVEYGLCEEVFYSPAHPYTWALLSSVPDLESKERLEAIPGTPPNLIYPPKGDAFAERNKYALEIDFKQQPPMFRITDTHYAATWLLHPMAPKVEIPAAITERIKRMKKEAERE